MVFTLLVDDVHDIARTSYMAVAAAGADLKKVGPPKSRHDVVRLLEEQLGMPFDPEEAWEYQRDLWAQRNVELMAAHADDAPNQVYGPAR